MRHDMTLPARAPEPVEVQPLTVRIREACRLTGIGRSKLYELIRAGEIRTIKVGAITLLPMTSLRAFLMNREASDSNASP